MLNKAIEIANRTHAGQVDKGGAPYILHPLRVMLSRENELERICAVLHDAVEDSDITFDDLRKEGFSEEVITILDCLTKRDGESYDEFIRGFHHRGHILCFQGSVFLNSSFVSPKS